MRSQGWHDEAYEKKLYVSKIIEHLSGLSLYIMMCMETLSTGPSHLG